MGLKNFLEAQSIKPATVARVSSRLEASDSEQRTLLIARTRLRREKEFAIKVSGKKYEEAKVAKPKTSGRGISEPTIAMAMADRPVARKVRGKVFRAVNAILAKQSKPPVDMKTLFGDVAMKVGAKKAEEKKA